MGLHKRLDKVVAEAGPSGHLHLIPGVCNQNSYCCIWEEPRYCQVCLSCLDFEDNESFSLIALSGILIGKQMNRRCVYCSAMSLFVFPAATDLFWGGEGDKILNSTYVPPTIEKSSLFRNQSFWLCIFSKWGPKV